MVFITSPGRKARGTPSAAAVNGKIYVIDGIEKRSEREYIITDKNEEYDLATNTT